MAGLESSLEQKDEEKYLELEKIEVAVSDDEQLDIAVLPPKRQKSE